MPEHAADLLLYEARDLLHHTGSHVRQPDGQYPPCPACDLEARIDAHLSQAIEYRPRRVRRFLLALTPAKKVTVVSGRDARAVDPTGGEP